MRAALLLAVIFGLFSVSAIAGTVQGKVTDERGAGLVGATIAIPALAKGARADKNGNFTIKNLPEGRIALEVRMVGFETARREITLKSDEDATVNFSLKQAAVQSGAVEVVGNRRRQEQTDTRPSVLTLDPKEAKFKAGAAEDVFRALQTMPGVTAPNDFSSQLIVRGSGPDQNLIVMDNIEIFNPYRLYGFVSMFNPETVAGINLITGGFPARYSDRLSAVLDISNREGTKDHVLGGKLNMSMTNANLVAEGGLPMLNGSWMLSTRRTYYDLIAGPIARATGAVDGDVALPNFRDLQAKITLQPHPEHKVSIVGITSRDNTELTSGANREQADSISVYDASLNDVIGTTWTYTPNENFVANLTVSYYSNRGSNNFGGQGGSRQITGDETSREEFEKLQDSLRKAGLDVPTLFSVEGKTGFNFSKAAAAANFSWKILPEHTIEAGAGYDAITTGVEFEIKFDPRLAALRAANPRIPKLPESFGSSIDFPRIWGWAQDNIRLGNLTILPGIRYDFFGILQKQYVSPRFSLSYALDPITTIRAAWGMYYQSPGYEKLFDRQLFLDLTPESVANLSAEKAVHYIAGVERMLTSEWQIRVEGYYKAFDDLILQEKLRGTNYRTERIPGKDIKTREGWTQPIPFEGDSLTTRPVNNATGESYGFEILLQKIANEGVNNLYGWVSYSFGVANRYRDGFTIPFNFDRRHTLNIVGGWKAADWLDVNFTWTYGSGFPTTQPVGIKPRMVLQTDAATGEKVMRIDEDWRGVVFDLDRGGDANLNHARLPDYHRLDVRATTYSDWFGWKWSWYIDVINVYNRRNIISENYTINRETLAIEKRDTAMLPILPTLGFSVVF